VQIRHVGNRAEISRGRCRMGKWDLMISDYRTARTFTGLDALKVVREEKTTRCCRSS